jgi:hypothetical protein
MSMSHISSIRIHEIKCCVLNVILISLLFTFEGLILSKTLLSSLNWSITLSLLFHFISFLHTASFCFLSKQDDVF